MTPEHGDAAYVFGVTLRLTPTVEGLSTDPATVETTLYREADPPGEEGWLFFRDNCWRGECNDHEYVRAEVASALDVADSDGVAVTAVDFRELRTDEAYLDALKDEIAANLDLFNADSTTEVLSKYLGSSIHVREG